MRPFFKIYIFRELELWSLLLCLFKVFHQVEEMIFIGEFKLWSIKLIHYTVPLQVRKCLITVSQEKIDVPSVLNFLVQLWTVYFFEVFALNIFLISNKQVCNKLFNSWVCSVLVFGHVHETLENLLFSQRPQITENIFQNLNRNCSTSSQILQDVDFSNGDSRRFFDRNLFSSKILPVAFEILVNLCLWHFLNVFTVIKQVIKFVAEFFLKNGILMYLEQDFF